MAVTRTIKGTSNNLSISAGSEITYLGTTAAAKDSGVNIRGFRVNPASTGSLIVTIDKSEGLLTMEIFQEDSYTAASPPSGYKKFANVVKDGKSKGVVAINVTDATKDYVVLLTMDTYAEFSYTGSVVVP